MKLRQVELDEINAYSENTLMGVLGMECVELGDDYLKIRMPVDSRTHQVMGMLHGGASAALIESIGSMGSSLLIDLSKEAPVGLEINANHVAGISSGNVVATGRIVHAGRRTHLWQVDLHEEGTERLICTGRLTVMIIPKP